MVEHPLQHHSTSLALLALLVVAPTLLFVVLSILAYEVGIPGLAARIEPFILAATAPSWVDLFLLLSPFVAVLITLVPLVSIGFSRVGNELRLSIGLRARMLNVVVLVICVLIGGLLVNHVLVEFLLERP